MSAPLDEARQLFGAASRDKTSFELLIETGRAPHETVGFLAHQACEKLIKAVLVLHGARIERTHDLEYLSELAKAGGVELPVHGNVLRQLNPYAVALRYEGSEVVWVTEEKAQVLVSSMYLWATTEIESASRGQIK